MRGVSQGGNIEVAKGEERRESMRIMVTFRIDPEKGDALIKEGRIGETMESILEELQPETAYFTDVEGTRGGYLVVNMDDASQIPATVEPLLLGLGATVQMHPVMTPEDLRGAAGEALQQVGQKYG
jgi:hypothetical protein